METKKFPGWRNALEIVMVRFEKEGYGILFSEIELLSMMDIKKPDVASYDAFQNFQLDKLQAFDKLRVELLEEFNICLENSRGEGYIIMHPADQVTKIANKYFRQSRKKINRMIKTLTNVDNDQLGQHEQMHRLNQLGKAAFIKSAMNKRKIVGSKVKIIK